jgi:hypothetical protein
MQQTKVNQSMEEYIEIFTLVIGVPLHYQVNHLIDLTSDFPLPSGPIYFHSFLEINEIKCQN